MSNILWTSFCYWSIAHDDFILLLVQKMYVNSQFEALYRKILCLTSQIEVEPICFCNAELSNQVSRRVGVFYPNISERNFRFYNIVCCHRYFSSLKSGTFSCNLCNGDWIQENEVPVSGTLFYDRQDSWQSILRSYFIIQKLSSWKNLHVFRQARSVKQLPDGYLPFSE